MGAWGVEPHACVHFVWLVAAIGEQRESAGCKQKMVKKRDRELIKKRLRPRVD
jgi:hypothetical protein